MKFYEEITSLDVATNPILNGKRLFTTFGPVLLAVFYVVILNQNCSTRIVKVLRRGHVKILKRLSLSLSAEL